MQKQQQACQASTSLQYCARDLEPGSDIDSEGASELPSSTDEVEHFGGCLEYLTDATVFLIESLMEEADLVHKWGITPQCSRLEEHRSMFVVRQI